MSRFRFGLVIFVKDEENTIGDVIDRAAYVVPSQDIFVVDGHSRDNTAAVVRAKAVTLFYDERRGKGAAIRQAVREIDRDILIFMDGDGSHQPEEIPQFIRAFREEPDADMVVASRFLGGSDELSGSFGNGMRRAGNRLSTGLINLRWRAGLTDVQNGFRAIRRRTACELGLRENSFAIEQEISMKCLQAGKKILEFPSWERRRRFNKSHVIPAKMFFPYVWSLIRNIVRIRPVMKFALQES